MTSPRSNPSALKNSEPILETLKGFIGQADKVKVFEVASGTGEHAKYFCNYFAAASWEPTEFDESHMDDIKTHCKHLKNVKQPKVVDISKDISKWGFAPTHLGKYDVGICINMVHISPIECTYGLFRNMSKLLATGGLLFTYGPYAVDGVISPQSNIDFHNSLKQRDPRWGLRDVYQLKEMSEKEGMRLEMVLDMPSNNKTLVFRRLPPDSDTDRSVKALSMKLC